MFIDRSVTSRYHGSKISDQSKREFNDGVLSMEKKKNVKLNVIVLLL